MITVQRRWFIPPHLYDEFRLRWLEEMGPVLPSLPGFIRAEIYDSAIPEQWTTLVTWDTEEHRVSAILTEEAIGFYARYSRGGGYPTNGVFGILPVAMRSAEIGAAGAPITLGFAAP